MTDAAAQSTSTECAADIYVISRAACERSEAAYFDLEGLLCEENEGVRASAIVNH